MSPAFLLAAVASQFLLATGQIQLKRAVSGTGPQFPLRFAFAIALMTLYFFTWLVLAQYLALSLLAPFDALAPVILVILACVLLRERLSRRAWVGVGLILAGVTTIALS